MFWGAWIPGLFHAKIADALGILTHFRKPDIGSHDPNSLWYENTHLDQLPITITSLTPKEQQQQQPQRQAANGCKPVAVARHAPPTQQKPTPPTALSSNGTVPSNRVNH